MSNNFLLNKLNFKYNYFSFVLRKSLQVGSIINVNMLKAKYKSKFFGIIIKKKFNSFGFSFTLRNVMKRYAIERTFNLNSKNILMIFLLRNKLNRFTSKNNLYYLRLLGKIYSTISL